MTATTDTRQELIDAFHKLWYHEAERSLTWASTFYMGHKVWKCPFDMWLYQELIYQIRPALIIETGTAFGGSALYYAHLFDQIGHGRVLTVDLKPIEKSYPRHPRISYMGGKSSTDPRVVKEVAKEVEWAGGPIMVILDSDHSQFHVRAELNNYAQFVTPSSYLIVEDTNVNGHPVFPDHGPGPYEAMVEWLPKHPEFSIDEKIPARMLFSMHHFLRRERT